MAKIKSGDLVQVISGADKGKQGKVLKVLPKENRVIVEGVKVVTKHTKANPLTGAAGGIQKVEAPIHVSNVAIVDPETKKPTRVGFRLETVERDGKERTERLATRTRTVRCLPLRSTVSSRKPTRVGFSVSGSTIATFET